MGFITCVFSLPIIKAFTILKSKEIAEREAFRGKESVVLACLETEQKRGSRLACSLFNMCQVRGHVTLLSLNDRFTTGLECEPAFIRISPAHRLYPSPMHRALFPLEPGLCVSAAGKGRG